MISSFEFTRPAPTTARIEHWCGRLEKSISEARFAAIAGAGFVGEEILRLIATDGAAASLVFAAALGFGLVGTILACRIVALHQLELGELRFFGLAPERILEAFLLTADTRRYAAEVVAQGRAVTIAELNLLALYAQELALFLRRLPVSTRAPMLTHIGFHPDIQFDWQ